MCAEIVIAMAVLEQWSFGTHVVVQVVKPVVGVGAHSVETFGGRGDPKMRHDLSLFVFRDGTLASAPMLNGGRLTVVVWWVSRMARNGQSN